MKSGYWRIVSVCFLTAMLTAAYSISTTFLNLQIPSGSQPADAAYAPSVPNSEVLLDTLRLWHLLQGTPLSGLFSGTLSDISSIFIDLLSTNISVFYSSLRAVNLILSEDFTVTIVFPVFGILFAFIYQVFVSNILIIGENRFFLENRNYPRTQISKIFFLYKLRYILRPAWVMFCRSFFQFLWNFTIIGGIIKHYEYLLIPYILA